MPHPLHVHCSNLGVPGNVDTTLATIDAAEGLPIHLTHVQFHSYGTEGDRKFSSAARRIAEAVNGARQRQRSTSGQIMFGQTVTASGDTMAQYRNAGLAQPRKWALMDIECDAGCGVVPFSYRDQNFVNALQWAIGLELFLLVEDPWRVFLTTDHPNGAPFTSYPHLIRLLMDNRSFRNEQLASIQPDAAAQSDAAGHRARVLAVRDRDHDARRRRRASSGSRTAAIWAPAPPPTSSSTSRRPTAKPCSARPRYVFKDGATGGRARRAQGRCRSAAPTP